MTRDTILSVRIPAELKNELRIAADFAGVTLSRYVEERLAAAGAPAAAAREAQLRDMLD